MVYMGVLIHDDHYQLGYVWLKSSLLSWINHKMVKTAVFYIVCMDYSSTGGCFKRFVSLCIAIRLAKLNLILVQLYHLRLLWVAGKLCQVGYVYNY